ncbi:hypothetical protein GOODEAATRI_026215 [Goodea atripinnis]|uniref:DNA methylase N-4/N-6 domain-containing protein n=1 Tax=Goodea atripinnis TaxID=208336 RepID=A0ABV0PH50_9TELE
MKSLFFKSALDTFCGSGLTTCEAMAYYDTGIIPNEYITCLLNSSMDTFNSIWDPYLEYIEPELASQILCFTDWMIIPDIRCDVLKFGMSYCVFMFCKFENDNKKECCGCPG